MGTDSTSVFFCCAACFLWFLATEKVPGAGSIAGIRCAHMVDKFHIEQNSVLSDGLGSLT